MNAVASQITGVSIVHLGICLHRPKKTSKLRVTGLCEENPSVTGGRKTFPFDDVIITAKQQAIIWTGATSLSHNELTHWVLMSPYWHEIMVATIGSLKHTEAQVKWPPYGRRYFQMPTRRQAIIGTNELALVQIMAWHRSGDKPLFVPMVVLLTGALYASPSLNELNERPF